MRVRRLSKCNWIVWASVRATAICSVRSVVERGQTQSPSPGSVEIGVVQSLLNREAALKAINRLACESRAREAEAAISRRKASKSREAIVARR
jgi:hypothetical protein